MNVEAQLTRCGWTRAEGDSRRQCIRAPHVEGEHVFEQSVGEEFLSLFAVDSVVRRVMVPADVPDPPKARACRECGEPTFGKLCLPCNALPDAPVDERLSQCHQFGLCERYSKVDMGMLFMPCGVCPHKGAT